MAPESVQINQIIQALRKIQNSISVPYNYDGQMKMVKTLLRNDETGLVAPILDFMTHSASVPIKIETDNPTLDAALDVWQKSLLNSNINIDIPRGLKELSTEYFRERWSSSFIVLKIQWETVDLGKQGKWIVPANMWFLDGSCVRVDTDEPDLTKRKYYVKEDEKTALASTKDVSVIIRKPFNSWYENYPTPFLVKRGVLFNALLKKAIISKQADVIQQIIPYLLLMRSGSDELARLNLLAGEGQMKDLKEAIIKSVNEYDTTGELGKLIATLSYDVNIEHFIPDLTKLFDEKVIRSTDKNILAGLGMIEVQGFAKTREESSLNPKALIEEVKDAVSDWTCLLEEVMYQMLEKNKANRSKLSLNKIRVVPGTIKAFMTDAMKTMLRNLYDRGLLSKQTAVEDIAEMDFEVQVERRKAENKAGLNKDMYPPEIQNFEQYPDATNPTKPQDNNIPDDKKPGSPEAKNFKNAEIVCPACSEEIIYSDLQEEYQGAARCEHCKTLIDKAGNLLQKFEAPYQTIDELPTSIKNNLPIAAQIQFMRVVNEALKDGKDESEAFKLGWGVVKKNYKKNPDGKWVKK